ncbi:GNAT family N-acetyltransferase [Streptomyces sp. NPDC002952]|uniref:GNAT family N-acetyltransferase n=1 Tax=Streptomyces sp. NPDC002952 TaxID=3364673 RepID=UPI0036CBB8E0
MRELNGPAALHFLTTHWRELYTQDPAATPYQSPQWLTGWARRLPRKATLTILVATAATGRPLAALALVREDGRNGTRIRPLSAPTAEYVRPVGPQAELPAIASSFAFFLIMLAEQGAHIEMTDVPADSALGHYLTQTCQDPSWDNATSAYATISLPIPYAAMSPSTKKSHRRRQRRWGHLADQGRVAYTRTRHTRELLHAYDVLAGMHQDRWKGQDLLPGTTIGADTTRWRDVLNSCGAGLAFIATLTVDNTPVAAQLCLQRGPRAFSVVPAMHPDARHLAPGHALLRHLAQDLADEGFHTLDLGRTAPGQHAYKAQYRPDWTSTIHAVTNQYATAA